MLRLRLTIFSVITFIGVSIGANNTTNYDLGVKKLTDRSEYCDWVVSTDKISDQISNQPSVVNGILSLPINEEINDHIWNMSQKLTPFRIKKIVWKYLPPTMELELNKIISKLNNEKIEIEKKISLIKDKTNLMLTSSKNESSDYFSWKSHSEDPSLYGRLTTDNLALTEKISRFNQRIFDFNEVLSLFRATYTQDLNLGNKKIPFLSLKLNLIKNFISQRIEVKPYWILPDENNVEGSDESLFVIYDNMIPRQLLSMFQNKDVTTRVFEAYFNYSNYQSLNPEVRSIAQTKQSTQPEIKWLADNSLLIVGTPASNRISHEVEPIDFYYTSQNNLALDGLLDLACIQKSRWTRKIINQSEVFLTDPQFKNSLSFNSVDPNSISALKKLKEL